MIIIQEINWIHEIKSFNEWLVTQPSIKADDILLWYTLMNLNNSCGWRAEFTLAVSTLKDKSRMSRTAIFESRNKLVQFGRIQVTSREGNQSAIYRMNFFHPPDGHSAIVSEIRTQSRTQVGTQSRTQVGTITKHSSIPSTPAPASEKIGEEIGSKLVVEIANKAWSDKLWREQLQMGLNIKTEQDLKQWMAQFNSSIAQDVIHDFKESSYKKMLRGWIVNQQQRGISLNTLSSVNGQQNGSAPPLTKLN